MENRGRRRFRSSRPASTPQPETLFVSKERKRRKSGEREKGRRKKKYELEKNNLQGRLVYTFISALRKLR